MDSEFDNEESRFVELETEAARDSDDKKFHKTDSSASELIPHHNAVSAIWQFFGDHENGMAVL